MESHRFEADVRQILHLVTHSLYSDREVFLRELVSNASDALDRVRFEGLKGELRPVEGEPGIRISFDEEAKTLTISDDGMGLTADEATEHLGTIARSGTKAFAEALEKKDDLDGLIGQFGVGFYSAFMVADLVEVHSLSAEEGSTAIRWTSDGGDAFELGEGDREARGTDVTLHIREDALDLLDADRLRAIVAKHSDYVAWSGEVAGERANQEEALWRRNPADLTDEDYAGFHKHVSGDWQDPLVHLHLKVEGAVEFRAVLFIPRARPWQLDRMDFKVGLKLFTKRIKVLDHADAFLPRWLRFVTGVVDTADVDLNISREILQKSPAVAAIRKQIAKKLLAKLEELSRTSPEDFATFWGEYGHILKEGIHGAAIGEETEKTKDKLTGLLRYPTTTSKGELRSLADVKAGLSEGQEDLWFIANVDKDRIASSPLLEGFKKRNWEVLLMSDPIDEWVVMGVPEFDGTALKSVAVGELPEVEDAEEDPVAEAAKAQAAPLVDWMKALLSDEVAEVRMSSRLTDSPSILVDQEGEMSANLQRILSAANQEVGGTKRVLEINPEHSMVKTLAQLNQDGATGLEPFARLLLDHAAIAEGRLDDPEGFALRLQTLMETAAKGMKA